MQNKTAAQIQAEIELIRLAYRRKCHSTYDTRILPILKEAIPYMLLATLTITALTYIGSLFFF